jgi:hypothetical protein
MNFWFGRGGRLEEREVELHSRRTQAANRSTP